jgi:hypothetical protein
VKILILLFPLPAAYPLAATTINPIELHPRHSFRGPSISAPLGYAPNSEAMAAASALDFSI